MTLDQQQQQYQQQQQHQQHHYEKPIRSFTCRGAGVQVVWPMVGAFSSVNQVCLK